MSAILKTLEQPVDGDVDVDVVRPRRRRIRDPARSAVRTTPGGCDKHVHCVIFIGEDGNGTTSPGPDGHVHKVIALVLKLSFGHSHDLSATRCTERHSEFTGRHVQASRR